MAGARVSGKFVMGWTLGHGAQNGYCAVSPGQIPPPNALISPPVEGGAARLCVSLPQTSNAGLHGL